MLFGNLSHVFEANKSALTITMIVTLILGGFIATYFSKEKKIQYGIYAGAVLFAINIFFLSINQSLGITVLIAEFFIIFLFTSIGGFLGGISYKNNEFHPVIAIIGGIVVTIILIGILGFFMDTRISKGITNFLTAAVPFVVGGFTTAFLAREKKIQYGICEGIFIVLFIILVVYSGVMMDINIVVNYYIIIGAIIGYFLAATIGSYLGKVACEYLKQKSEKSTT